MDETLISILCCPVTGQSLRLLGREELSEINRRIREGVQRRKDGRLMEREVEACLVTEDGGTGYPVYRGLVVLLPEEALELRSGSKHG